MGIPILDAILMQRVVGQCIWIPRVSLFLVMALAIFIMPPVVWLSIGITFLCLTRIVMRNVALSRQVATAADLCGKTYRYFNERALGTHQSRAAVADTLRRKVMVSVETVGRQQALRFTPWSSATREAVALACAVIYYYGDCDEAPIRDAGGITLKLRTGAPEPARRALYDRMLGDVLGVPVALYTRVGEPMEIEESVADECEGELEIEESVSAILQIDPTLRLELWRTSDGISLRSCSPDQVGEVVTYANAAEVLQTWGALLDRQQRDIVMQVGGVSGA